MCIFSAFSKHQQNKKIYTEKQISPKEMTKDT